MQLYEFMSVKFENCKELQNAKSFLQTKCENKIKLNTGMSLTQLNTFIFKYLPPQKCVHMCPKSCACENS